MQIEELTAGIASVSSEVAKFDGIAAGLAALEKAHPKDIACDVQSTAGMKQAIAGRAAWRTPRIEVEKARKAAKAPVLELGRAIDTFAKELEAKLLAGENHYDEQIKAEEKRKETLRIEAAQRVLRLRAGIDAIKASAAPFAGLSSAAIEAAIDQHEATPPTEYEEFQADAEAAHATALTQLRAFHATALEREAEAARIKAEQDAEAARLKAEREELNRLRAEQKRLDDEAAERRREADRAAAAERAEADRQAREARQEEERRLAAERAELRRQEEDAAAQRRAEAQAREEAQAADRQRLRDEAQKAFEAEARLHGAAQQLLDALVLAAPFVTDDVIADQCRVAIEEATGAEALPA